MRHDELRATDQFKPYQPQQFGANPQDVFYQAPAGGGATTCVLEHTDTGSIAGVSGAQEYVWSGVPIGSAASDRIVVVSVVCAANATGVGNTIDLKAVQVDNDTGTTLIAAEAEEGNYATAAEIAAKLKTTGTTATITAKCSMTVTAADPVRYLLSVYSLKGAGNDPAAAGFIHDTGASIQQSPGTGFNMDVPADGSAFVASSVQTSNQNPSFFDTGGFSLAREQTWGSPGSAAGHILATSVESQRAFTHSWSGSGQQAETFIGVSVNPA